MHRFLLRLILVIFVVARLTPVPVARTLVILGAGFIATTLAIALAYEGTAVGLVQSIVFNTEQTQALIALEFPLLPDQIVLVEVSSGLPLIGLDSRLVLVGGTAGEIGGAPFLLAEHLWYVPQLTELAAGLGTLPDLLGIPKTIQVAMGVALILAAPLAAVLIASAAFATIWALFVAVALPAGSALGLVDLPTIGTLPLAAISGIVVFALSLRAAYGESRDVLNRVFAVLTAFSAAPWLLANYDLPVDAAYALAALGALTPATIVTIPAFVLLWHGLNPTADHVLWLFGGIALTAIVFQQLWKPEAGSPPSATGAPGTPRDIATDHKGRFSPLFLFVHDERTPDK